MSRPKISEISVEYYQDEDSVGRDGFDIQELKIKTCDAGSGKYFIIETTRWAFDSIEELVATFKDFEKRVKESD